MLFTERPVYRHTHTHTHIFLRAFASVCVWGEGGVRGKINVKGSKVGLLKVTFKASFTKLHVLLFDKAYTYNSW
jgi:hypothetical protein